MSITFSNRKNALFISKKRIPQPGEIWMTGELGLLQKVTILPAPSAVIELVRYRPEFSSEVCYSSLSLFSSMYFPLDEYETCVNPVSESYSFKTFWRAVQRYFTKRFRF